MSRFWSAWRLRTLAFALLTAAAWPLFAQESADEWKFDQVSFSGTVFQGLILDETATEVRFQDVRHRPGHPTVTVVTTFPKTKVTILARLDAADRRELVRRLRALDPTGKLEDERIKPLELKPAVWMWGTERKEGLSYDNGVHFCLFSTARRDIVERAVVRLEEIYAAYTLHVPPRQPLRRHEHAARVHAIRRLFAAPDVAAPPLYHKSITTILLVESLDEYRELLRNQGRDILHPAFYDAENNEVVCASELQRLGTRLEQVRLEHERQQEGIKKEEAQLGLLPPGEVRDRVQRQIDAARAEIIRVNADNEARFRKATQDLFQTLYHEAFHAYLANFVYPPAEHRVPRWLNEGLAQVFETAIVEAGVPRFNAPDPVRLERLKEAFAAGTREDGLVPLADLLRSGPEQFLVSSSSSNRRGAARYYLTSWALAYYLTFDRQLLGTPALDRYVAALTHEVDPREAFARLVGQPLPRFEQDFHEYLKKLASMETRK
jgi:hypothetical protein